jgi:chitin disaccharide deacetylase
MTIAPPSSHARVGVPSEAVAASPVRVGAGESFPVIVHADDFGETVEITNGIRSGIEAGVVTSTSVLVNMPGTAYALRLAPALADRASFGVHLNFCEGIPLTVGGTLVRENGQFHPKRALFARAITGRLSLRELEAEITAQVGRVHDAGVRISHIDGHKHLHQLPIVSAAVANVLPRFSIRRVRITRLGSLRAADKPSTFVREIVAWHAGRVFLRARLRSPVRTVDLTAISAHDVRHRRTASIVDPLGIVEVCCHPGTPAADLGKPGSHRRSEELEYLLSPRFRELLTMNRARLVSYWQV